MTDLDPAKMAQRIRDEILRSVDTDASVDGDVSERILEMMEPYWRARMAAELRSAADRVKGHTIIDTNMRADVLLCADLIENPRR